jgi:hypothetical protein
MITTKVRRPTLSLTLLSVCLLVLGINGFIGGYLMLSDPNGAPMGMPVSDLARTPFQNFFIPGLLLIFVWGCGSLLTLIGLWLRPQWLLLSQATRWTDEHWAWDLSLALGLALIIWLTVQVFTLPAVAPIQLILYALAIALVVLPLLPQMRQYYQL